MKELYKNVSTITRLISLFFPQMISFLIQDFLQKYTKIESVYFLHKKIRESLMKRNTQTI